MNTFFFFMGVEMILSIKYGQKGDEVTALQKKLIKLGLLKAVADDGTKNDDGVFGRITEVAVRDFQAANGLEADGIVGQATRKALGLAPVPVPKAAATAKSLFTEAQRTRIAEKLDGLIPTGPFDFIDGPLFMWAVERMEAVLAAHLPKSFVDTMNDLNKGLENIDEFKERLTKAVNGKINIPFLSEKVEEQLFRMLIDLIVKSLNLGQRLDGLLRL